MMQLASPVVADVQLSSKHRHLPENDLSNVVTYMQ